MAERPARCGVCGFELTRDGCGVCDVKRLKAQRSEIVRIVKEMWAQSYRRLTEEDGGRFQEGGLAYMITLDRKLKVLIASGKPTMAEANAHQRGMNPDWIDA